MSKQNTKGIHEFSFEGNRVELHPATDQWAMGDQWGTVRSIDLEKGVVEVYMDRSKKVLRVMRGHLMPRESARALLTALDDKQGLAELNRAEVSK